MSTQEQEKTLVTATGKAADPVRDNAAREEEAAASSPAPEQQALDTALPNDRLGNRPAETGSDAWEDVATVTGEADGKNAADKTAGDPNAGNRDADDRDAGQEKVPATAAAGGSGGSLPPKTRDVSDDDVPALPDDEEGEGEEEEGEGGRMSLMDHLRELRQRILYSLVAAFVAFLLCWYFVEPVFNFLTRPLLDVLPEGSTAMYTTLPEAFFTRMYIAFILGLFVASPVIFYQIWAFISPGLYEEEKHFIMPVAIISAIFFVLGGVFCYYIVFHYAFQFFISFVTAEIQAMPKISDYLDFVLKLILAFGFIFEMPIFAFFLSRMGIVTAAKMRRARRYAILIIFIVAAILTPPDVVSQLLMAVPMLILYEISILVAALFGKKEEPKPEEENEDYADDEDYDSADESGDDADRKEPAATAPKPQSQPQPQATQAARPAGKGEGDA